MNSNSDKIAIIGLAGKFPGSRNLDEYWNNLLDMKETIQYFTDEELEKFEVDYSSLRKNPSFVKARGILQEIENFDAAFFGMNPKEAAATDPQHRIWLETVWEAFEDAGCDPFRYPGAIGVFAGSYINTYLWNNILRDRTKFENYLRLRTTESFQFIAGNDPGYLPTKTAYKFNLRGPALNIQTACSTSLVAIIQACQSLMTYESDVCVTGGVCVLTPQESGYIHQEGAIPSPDGHCRPFDHKAAGTVFSNGVGVVILKRYDDAVADNDRIYGLVSGWALNNDGNSKVSYTAPSVEGQANAIRSAISFANITADQISYIEAHGTATKLGDPIEISGLSRAFAHTTGKKQFCAIGSVKSNIGHTDAAAGVASFIKVALSAYHRIVPPSINFEQPNPYIDFENSPFYVLDKKLELNPAKPIIMGVSSFGIGGTNAHLIVESTDSTNPEVLEGNPAPEIIALSAKTETALQSLKEKVLKFIIQNESIRLQDIAYTLQVGRTYMPYRLAFAVNDRSHISDSAENAAYGKHDDQKPGVIFMFPGQGAQYPGMGRDLYHFDKESASILDRGIEIIGQITGQDLKKLLFSESSDKQAMRDLSVTLLTQPALFIIEYAVARFFISKGIIPESLIGHSIGEFAAASIAGVFDFETGLKIVLKRGQLMNSMPNGRMLSVRTNYETLSGLEQKLFEIAADNSRALCSISFPHEKYDKVVALLQEKEISYADINTSHAFHSEAFDPILAEFAQFVNQFELKAPKIPFISCLSGEMITTEDAISGDYWAKQLRNTVKFSKGISQLAENQNVMFIETGPNTHLSSFVRQNPSIQKKQAILASLGKPSKLREDEKLYTTIGGLWANGYELDFSLFRNSGKPNKLSLPTYPFERKRHWIDYIPDEMAGIQVSNTQTEKDDTASSYSSTVQDSSPVRLQEEIKLILSELSGFKTEDLKEDVVFDSMGFDSLFLTQFAVRLEKRYTIRVEFRKLALEYPTIQKLAEFLLSNSPVLAERKIQQEPVPKVHTGVLNNFAVFQDNGNKAPVVMVHGDEANIFLPKTLGSDQPFYGYFHIAADGDRIPFSDTVAMANHYVNQLLAHNAKGPFLLGGFSFGGILAFEMALQLQKMGYEIPMLVLIDSKSPYISRKDVSEAHFLVNWLLKTNDFLVGNFKRIYYKTRKTLLYYYVDRGSRIPVQLRKTYTFDKYNDMIRTYRTNEKYEGEILLFRASKNKSKDRYLGWDKIVGHVRLIYLEGDHGSLLKEEISMKLFKETFNDYVKEVQQKITKEESLQQ